MTHNSRKKEKKTIHITIMMKQREHNINRI
jgi:hypothetical protein